MPVKRIYRILFLIFFIIAVWWVIGVTSFVNAVYVPYVYPAVHYGITRLSYLFPFPLGEVLYAACILFVFIYSFRRIKTLITWLGWMALLEKTMFTCCITYLVFLLMWGMNYYRQPVYEHYNVLTDAPTPSDYEQAATYLADCTDSLWHLKNDTGDYIAALNKADWKIYTPRITDVRVKPSILGATEDILGVDGYFNPFTGEGQIQKHLPAILLPFIEAHEAAHVYGIALEDDANWCAYRAGINTPYNKLAASTSFNVLLYVLHNLHMADTVRYRMVWNTLPINVRIQIKDVRTYYAQHKSPAEGFMRSVFNSFLKFNGQNKGIESYNSLANWATIDIKNKYLLKAH